MLGLGAEAGSRPGGRGTFLCFAKEKYPKERRPTVCDPCAALRGKPASGRLRGAPWNSLRCCAAPFGQPRRVSGRSMRAATRMPTPQAPRRRRSQKGFEGRNPHGPSLRSARLARRAAPATLGAERRDGPKPTKPFCTCREAQSAGRACAAGHTPLWSDLLRLSERSAAGAQ